MKKLMVALIWGLVLAPVFAWGQQWVDPQYTIDGTYVPGHWKTAEDYRQDRYSTPGKVNPYTGQFNPYTSSLQGPQAGNPAPFNPNPMGQSSYYPQPYFQYPGAPTASPLPVAPNPFYPQPDYRYKGR